MWEKNEGATHKLWQHWVHKTKDEDKQKQKQNKIKPQHNQEN
jgi:hypothetical protein